MLICACSALRHHSKVEYVSPKSWTLSRKRKQLTLYNPLYVRVGISNFVAHVLRHVILEAKGNDVFSLEYLSLLTAGRLAPLCRLCIVTGHAPRMGSVHV